ncbi:MAG: radical SAM protein [Dissulfuribacterales bacterium]
MSIVKPHKNITARRLALDFYQFVRAQSVIVRFLGRQFHRSQEYVEMDITYKCNLKCANCNRSCAQLPSRIEMSVEQVENFIQESIEHRVYWKRIRILGGEPTLHSRFFDIIELLLNYRKNFNPDVRLVLCTNLFGNKIKDIIGRLPEEITIKSTVKTSPVNLFRPFNMAPVDTWYNRFSDYSCGCRIIEDCGLGLTPSGYYMCAIAGGIDRVFGFDRGRETLPSPDDSMADQMKVFCRLCGHFGFAWPVKTQKLSHTWQQAYKKPLQRTAISAPLKDEAP